MARPKRVFPSAEAILQLVDDTGHLAIKVTPNASADSILLPDDDKILAVRVTATPESGRANRCVLRLLAKALGRPVSSLELVRGQTGRNKVVRLG